MRVALAFALAFACCSAAELPANRWVQVDIDWKKALPEDIPDASWSTTDGYSDNVYRAKTRSVIIRTGVRSKSRGLDPGFYTNTSVAWDLATDTARVIDIANWGGGSYGHGKLLPAYREHPTPTPRHTYDGICPVPEKDCMYLMLGANWRIGARDATDEAKSELKNDGGRTWRYDFETRRWTCIEDNVWKLFKCSPYENHMQYWPQGQKLLFLNDGGNRYAEFDLDTQRWSKVDLANPCPMSLYNARSAWDSKRALWVFRLGPRLCTFDPKTKAFAALPNCYDMPIPSRTEIRQMQKEKKTLDPRLFTKAVCYISRHDVYLVPGPTGNDTAVYDPEQKTWTAIAGGAIEHANGYCQYCPELDVVAMNFQHKCYKFR